LEVILDVVIILFCIFYPFNNSWNFYFFVSTLYAYLKIDDFGVGDIIFNLLNGILIGFFTSIFILIWGEVVEFIDRISRK